MQLLRIDTAVRSERQPSTDTLGRPLRSLRVSVTDRCNLRCQYCMPEEEYVWLARQDLLTFEEITALVNLFTDLGVDKVRLTGGEPLLRKDLPTLVRMLTRNPRLTDLALTTNGVLLAEQTQALYDAGLHRVTVSLDTLDPGRFQALTRRDTHAKVLAGIDTTVQVGFTGLKIDTVVMRGYNDDELIDLLEYGKRVGAEVRFIEYMDVGGGNPVVDGQSLPSHGYARGVVSPLWAHRTDCRGQLGACPALPAPRRNDVRHYRLNHDAVL